MLKSSNIDFVIDKSRVEGLKDLTTDVVPTHFLGILCGKPGSGKTTLLKFLLSSDKLLFKKYDFIFIVTPSKEEFKTLFLPSSNFKESLQWEWVNNKIDIINKKFPNDYINVLFIFDDVVTDINKSVTNGVFLKFIFNRRHLIKNGMISVLMTTQKYTKIPSAVRSNINFLVAFNLMKFDWKKIEEEVVYVDREVFNNVRQFIFEDKDVSNFMMYNIDTNTFYKKFDKIII